MVHQLSSHRGANALFYAEGRSSAHTNYATLLRARAPNECFEAVCNYAVNVDVESVHANLVFLYKIQGRSVLVCVFAITRPPRTQEAILSARCGKLGKYNYTRCSEVCLLKQWFPSVSRLLCLPEPISAAAL
jgi:hypothetical protein